MRRLLAGFLTGSIVILAGSYITGIEEGPWGSAHARSDLGSGKSFLCPSPEHHDGDAIRCGSKGRSMRLYAIDAPEMPGACRSGRRCTQGNAFASRDHLAALTKGRSVSCHVLDQDRYGRKVVRCFADQMDLSCAMVHDGYAVERYGKLRC
ncbi:thermonuclease family protein [Sphingomonas crocodyli]|nr:thermonuclease family protein [Sphingomonas crocodyli]